MISGHATIQTAVEATKAGAYDFLEKPLDRDRILLTLRNALAREQLNREVEEFRQKLGLDREILGESEAIREILTTVATVGPTQGRVLITGENGTGKQLVARAIHRSSDRRERPFVEVNCAAIPSELIESELFGHEKGAFTSAVARRAGKFELADGGTIFLDEVGDMSLPAQAKVLRVLEEAAFERVGGTETLEVDVRVIAATNQDLASMVDERSFREDLYYRLRVVPIHIPPLRERPEDVGPLARHFLEEHCRINGLRAKRLAPPCVEALARHSWPGNVRELRNVVERMAIMNRSEELSPGDIPALGDRKVSASPEHFGEYATYEEYRNATERAFLEEKLRRYGWNVSRTARAIEMQRSNLYRKLQKHGLSLPPRGDTLVDRDDD
jgi:two-component system nitrogen regulation response regulator NtrX